jgi:hypothetical protein
MSAAPPASGLGDGAGRTSIQWTGDVSHVLGPNDRLHGYYAFQRDERGEPNLQGNNIPGFGDTRKSHRQIFTLNETHTFGPQPGPTKRASASIASTSLSARTRNSIRSTSESGRRQRTTSACRKWWSRRQLNMGGPAELSAGPRRHHLRFFRHRSATARQSFVQVWRRVPALLQQQLQPSTPAPSPLPNVTAAFLCGNGERVHVSRPTKSRQQSRRARSVCFRTTSRCGRT